MLTFTHLYLKIHKRCITQRNGNVSLSTRDIVIRFIAFKQTKFYTMYVYTVVFVFLLGCDQVDWYG